jgi:hypothetical protein
MISCKYCHSCIAVTGVKCDSCGIVSNPLAESRVRKDDGTTLREECESERHRLDILRIDPYLDRKESMK